MQITASCYTSEFAPEITRNGHRRLRFSIDDLAHAMFTVGRAPGDRSSHGFSSVYEWLHRVAMIPAYLRVTPVGGLERSPLAKSLDRSEKVGLSYALGQATTALFCVSEIGVTYMMHHDRYARHHRITYSSTSKQRPDLFGLRHAGGWVVAEAKGRSNTMETALYETLKQQKQVVATINGLTPDVALGCVASFPPPLGEMRVNAIDPKDISSDPMSLVASQDSFLLAYYAPLVAALDLGTPSQEVRPGFETAEFAGARVQISLVRGIVEAVRQADSNLDGLTERIASALDQNRTEPDGLFADGFSVRGDWVEELTLRNEF